MNKIDDEASLREATKQGNMGGRIENPQATVLSYRLIYNKHRTK